MGVISGEIRDAKTREILPARVQVVGPTGDVLSPVGAMWKRGPGEPFFYSDGQFDVDVPRGLSRLLVERGTEYVPWQTTVDVANDGRNHVVLDVQLDRWTHLPALGWHPGNTHLHYDENEDDPDRRLRYDSRVEDMRMTAVSILQRGDLAYATNAYPPGVLTQFTDSHHFVQCGQEVRHNHDPNRPFAIGYGHVMLLNLDTVVTPVSRGFLVDQFAPDYPPLTYACSAAADEDGLVIWCHNGQGMEAPVAAALGKVDAMNLFDPYWMDPEYDLWYAMLNCGIHLPASTGTDWFVSSGNRVYAKCGTPFSYPNWLAAMRAGRTFVTNGPSLLLSVSEAEPGDTVEVGARVKLPVQIAWQSHQAIERIELIVNGELANRWETDEGTPSGSHECEIEVKSDGWVAARLSSTRRDSFRQPLWAHTSPIYIHGTGRQPVSRSNSAAMFVDRISEAVDWVTTKGRFYTSGQRREIVDLHQAGIAYYSKLMGATPQIG